jgi:hypothetical protein
VSCEHPGVEPVYFLAAWQTPRATTNSAAKKIFHEREKTTGTPDEVARLRSDVLTVLGPDASFEVVQGMATIEVPDSRLRAASAGLLAVVAAAGYILPDPQVGRLVVPMTKTAAPWPPMWTQPIAELREALASDPVGPGGVDEHGELDVKAFMTELAADKGWEIWQVGDPLPPEIERRRHVAPELEALIPAGLVDSKDAPTSVRATDYGAPTVNRALKVVGVRPRDAVVVNTLGGKGRDVHTVTIFGVPGIAADALAAAFAPAIFKPRSVGWEPRAVDGRTVWWAESKGYLQGGDFTAAWWTRDGLVFWVTGQPAWIESAATRLP